MYICKNKRIFSLLRTAVSTDRKSFINYNVYYFAVISAWYSLIIADYRLWTVGANCVRQTIVEYSLPFECFNLFVLWTSLWPPKVTKSAADCTQRTHALMYAARYPCIVWLSAKPLRTRLCVYTQPLRQQHIVTRGAAPKQPRKYHCTNDWKTITFQTFSVSNDLLTSSLAFSIVISLLR